MNVNVTPCPSCKVVADESVHLVLIILTDLLHVKLVIWLLITCTCKCNLLKVTWTFVSLQKAANHANYNSCKNFLRH